MNSRRTNKRTTFHFAYFNAIKLFRYVVFQVISLSSNTYIHSHTQSHSYAFIPACSGTKDYCNYLLKINNRKTHEIRIAFIFLAWLCFIHTSTAEAAATATLVRLTLQRKARVDVDFSICRRCVIVCSLTRFYHLCSASCNSQLMAAIGAKERHFCRKNLRGYK